MGLTAIKYKQTEVGLIPEDWEIKDLGQLAKVIGGGTPKTNEAEYWNGKISWFTPTEVGKQKYLFTSNRKITHEGLQRSSAQILPIGTILLTSRAGIGDLGILTKEAATNQGFQSLLVYDEYDNEYVYYLLSTLKPKLLSKASGSTFLEISPSNVKGIRVGIPSTLTEQKAIAQVLSDTDSLIQALENKIAKKKLIKNGVMQKLLCPNSNWIESKVGSIGQPYGGMSGKTKADFSNGNAHYVPFMNVMSNPIIDTGYLDSVNINKRENQNKILKGDLLFNGSSETPEEVGFCSAVLEQIDNLYLNSFCFGFRILNTKQHDSLFLAYFFRSSLGREFFYSLAQGATRYNLSKTNFLKSTLTLPIYEDQVQIATLIRDIDSEIENLKQKLSKYELAKQGMMQQLLTGKIRLI